MGIKEFKLQIESGNVNIDAGIIFSGRDSYFLKKQYLTELAKLKNLEVVYLDGVAGIQASSSSCIFSINNEVHLNVVTVESFKDLTLNMSDLANTIILVEALASEAPVELQSYCIDFPKLEDWQIKDYAYSLLEGLTPVKVEWLLSNCKDINRLDLEIQKLKVFLPSDRDLMFDRFMQSGDYNDFSSISNFDFSNAVVSKDLEKLRAFFTDGLVTQLDGFMILGLLISNFRNLIRVKYAKFPTPENTGLSSKQLYVVTKYSKLYGAEQLIDIFKGLVELDVAAKTGKISIKELIDLIVIKVMG